MSQDRPVPSVAVVGGGVVGQRVRRNLSTSCRLVPADVSADIVVLARPGQHASIAPDYLTRGMHVVSTTGVLDDVRELLDLDDVARGNGVSLVVGTAMAPGLSGLLARYVVRRMSRVDELHV